MKYALVVVDEAHHLVSDAALRAQLPILALLRRAYCCSRTLRRRRRRSPRTPSRARSWICRRTARSRSRRSQRL